MTEENKYKIIKKLVETQGNKKRAALKLGCTDRHINRLIRGYKEHGKLSFVLGIGVLSVGEASSVILHLTKFCSAKTLSVLFAIHGKSAFVLGIGVLSFCVFSSQKI